MSLAGLLLAAGRSRRMGAENKLLLPGPDGRPMILHSLAPLRAVFAEVTVVLGHEAPELRAALAAEPVTCLEAADYAEGLAGSLRAGIAALGPEVEGVLVALGDMPCIAEETLRRLAAAHRPGGVALPEYRGRIGNPVLWDRAYFPAMLRLSGDRGAKSLLPEPPALCRVAVEDEGVLIDFDTQESLKDWRWPRL